LEDLCSVLFELSNQDRLRILHQLDKGAMNVTNLARELGLTVQECSRHVSRLDDVGLTEKDVEGLLHVSPYGRLVLKQLLGLKFTSRYRDYFATHSLAHLPRESVLRIGDLAASSYVGDISAAFHSVDKMIQEAEEYVWSITDQHLVSTYPLLRDALERGVKVKEIEAKGWVVHPKLTQEWYAKDAMRQDFLRARTTGLLEERMLERLDVYLYMSEKEVAAVAFTLPDGGFDYLGFTATDQRSHKWCRDLFQHYWDKARNRARVVEELYNWIKKRPEAIGVLMNIAEGEMAVGREELVSELEKTSLIKRGKLTVLGQFVCAKFRQ